jgi:hypothetical protein
MNAMTVSESRNWMSYLMDSLVNSGVMPAWEALEYLTTNLVGEAPNQNLHHSKSPYETIQQFLHRVYGPIVEAASRTVESPKQSMIHMFTDISLMGKSAVLVVYHPGHNQPHQLLLLDTVPAWEIIFESSTAFNEWAEERFGWIVAALKTEAHRDGPAPVEQVAGLQSVLVEY